MIRFILKGETPAKKNSKIWTRSGKLIPSKRYQDWHMTAGAQIVAQMLQQKTEPIETPVSIKLNFQHGDLRRRDSDNGTSSVLDLLVDAGILSDDNWQIVSKLQITNTYEKGNPMCTIEIEKLN